MKYIVTISRILLGLIFVTFGLNGFLHFIPSPQYQGVAGQFIGAIFASHLYVVIFLTQIVGGRSCSPIDTYRWGCSFSVRCSSTFSGFTFSCPQRLSPWRLQRLCFGSLCSRRCAGPSRVSL